MRNEMKVEAKLTVSEETAETCLKLVNIYLNSNSNIDIITENLPSGEIALRFIERGGR